jgi:hypothetical protein
MTSSEWDTSTDPQAMLVLLRDSDLRSDRKLRLFACACVRRVWDQLRDDKRRKAIEVAERCADGLVPDSDLRQALSEVSSARDGVNGAVAYAVQEAALRYTSGWTYAPGTASAVVHATVNLASAGQQDAVRLAIAHATQAHAAVAAAEAAQRAASRAADEASARAAHSLYQAACARLATAEGEARAAQQAAKMADETVSSAHKAAQEQVAAVERAAQAALLRDLYGPLPFRRLPLAPSLLDWQDGLILKLAQAAYDDRLLPSGHLDPDRLSILCDALLDAGCDDAELLGHLRSEGPHYRGCFAVDLLLGKN